MCGLAGVMSRNLDMTQLSKFKDIYTIAQIRGDTGAGVAVVPLQTGNSIRHVGIRRTTWSSGHLVTTSDFFDAVKKPCSIVVGHARAPTRGGSDIKNVHPHRHGDIILVHNGTMTTVDRVPVTVGQKHTDSAMIAECISEKGPHHFVENSIGAYALVWIDLKNQTLNFLRNSERTLWLGMEKDSAVSGKLAAVWWASEMPMMMYPLSRYSGYVKERFDYKALPTNEWWSWPLNVEHVIVEPTVEKCEKKLYAVGQNYGHGWAYGEYDDDYGAYGSASRSGGSSSVASGAGSSSSGAVSSVKTTTSGAFKYTPPEYRGGQKEDAGGEASKGTFLSVPEILNRRKAMASRATGRAQADEDMAANQKRTKYLLSYACTDDEEIALKLKNGACVWCNETPTEVIAGIAPTIFPIKHTENRHEYVCSSCITDDVVQTFVGIKKEAM